MSSNLKVNTILPSTGTAIGIGTAAGDIDILGHIVGHNTPNISGINSVTANHFYGDISNATGAAAGLGTALSQDQSNPLNKLYYTDRILSIGSTITIDHPASATGAYTQYADILVEDNADLIVADGDDLIPDILGLGGNGTTGAGGAGRLLVDNIVNRSGTGAPSFPNGAVVTGIVTATSLKTDRIIPTGGVPSGGGGGIIQVVSTNVDSTSSITLSNQYSYYPITALDTTITTVGANSKILVTAGIGGEANHEDYHLAFRCGRVIGGSLQIIFKGADAGSRTTALAMGNTGYFADDQNSTTAYNSFSNMLDSPNQPAGTAITYRFYVSTLAGNNATYFLNRTVNDGNDATKERLFSYLTLMEISV